MTKRNVSATPLPIPSNASIDQPNGAAGDDVRGERVFQRHHDIWIEAVEDWTVWLDSRGLGENTIRQHRWRIRDFATRYAASSPWKLKTSDLYRWYTRPGWGLGMRNNARATLRSFYRWAVKEGRTKRNPADDLDSISIPQGLPRPADEKLVQRVIAESDDRVRLMVVLAAYGGLRDMEIANLRWIDVTDAQIILIGKGGKTRTIWIHSRVAEELRTEKARRDDGKCGSGYRFRRDLDRFVFPSQHGGPMSPNRVCQILSEALGPDTTGHQLRHRFATEVLNEYGDITAVQQLLGHANANTTRTYAAVADRRLRDAVNSIK